MYTLQDTWTQIRIGDSLVFRCQESCKRSDDKHVRLIAERALCWVLTIPVCLLYAFLIHFYFVYQGVQL